MLNDKLLRLVTAAVLAALACVATMVVSVPIPATKGYFNLGDCIVLLCGLFLGPVYGALAGGLGSALADLFLGYAVYAPGTFIIKGCMALFAALIFRALQKNLNLPRRFDRVKWESDGEKEAQILINKRKIGTCIILSIVTCGIYLIYWEYLLVKNTRAVKKESTDCAKEILCLIFVPFYALYWWFTRGKAVKSSFAAHGYSATGNENAYLVLGIFCLGLVSMAIMQNDFNSLPSEEVLEAEIQSGNTGISAPVAVVPAALWMAAGYFLYESTLLGYGMAALGSVPANLLQGAVGAVAAAVLFHALRAVPAIRRFIEK